MWLKVLCICIIGFFLINKLDNLIIFVKELLLFLCKLMMRVFVFFFFICVNNLCILLVKLI